MITTVIKLKIKGLIEEKKKINPKNKTLNKETINRINKTKTRKKINSVKLILDQTHELKTTRNIMKQGGAVLIGYTEHADDSCTVKLWTGSILILNAN